MVHEKQGEVHAYMFAQTAPADLTRFETRVTIQDAAISTNSLDSLGYLLSHILVAAHRYGASTIRARLPLDFCLYPIYRDYILGFIPTLWQTTESGNMLQIIDFSALMKVLIPEFQNRLQNSVTSVEDGDWQICVNEQEIYFRLRQGQLTCIDKPEPTDSVRIDLSQEPFCNLLLGLQSVCHVVRQLPVSLPRESIAFLTAIFPP
ncbi:TPA: hypothetical protein EYN98_05925 [Candidatus Poribacteria bacterium]|nr:hypothetical protein [Candidatus Poribacteria bacterium]